MATIKENQNKISFCLWFNENALEAANFYTSIFKNSKIGNISYYGKNSPMPEGTVLTVTFQLEGIEFMALNGGDLFKFTEAFSIVVNCENQNEINGFWDKLSDGGQVQQCGWLKDKFGVSWQIVPTELGELLQSKESEKANKVMQSMLQMIKIDIDMLREIFNN